MRASHAQRTVAARATLAVLLVALALWTPAAPSVARVFPYRLPEGAIVSDVVVYGGTPGGVMAAVSAARAGARVALVVPHRHVGGMMSNGLSATDIGDPSTLGGLTKEFFDRVQAIEGSARGRFRFEPHVAEQVFGEMLGSAGVAVYLDQRLEPGSVVRDGARIVSFTTSAGKVFGGFVFIDASYEGDLLAAAGVSFTIGREATTTYGESLAGIRPAGVVMTLPPGVTLPWATTAPSGPVGAADSRVQDDNYRVCFSSDPQNQVPFSPPPGYSPSRYAIVTAYLHAREAKTGKPAALSWELSISPLVHDTFDVNAAGHLSIALTGTDYGWAEGSATVRARIAAAHEAWERGLLYFLRNDPSVPGTVRSAMAQYGLCRDEFTDNGSWPRQLYVREARRMVGSYVLTQADIVSRPTKPDVIGIASYRVDTHAVSLWVDSSGRLLTEGAIALPYSDWEIPYRALTPRADQVRNLLVTCAISASHVAFGSFRMEPQYMLAGEAAGVAAWLALPRGTGGQTFVQEVSVRALQQFLRAHGSVLAIPPRAS